MTYDSRPIRIVLDGDEELAQAQLPAAYNLLHRIESFIKTSGVEAYASGERTPNGYVYAKTVGDIRTVMSFAEGGAVDPLEQEYEFQPKFRILSGIVTDGTIGDIREHYKLNPTTNRYEFDREEELPWHEKPPAFGAESDPTVRYVKALRKFVPTPVAARFNRQELRGTGPQSSRALAIVPAAGFDELKAPPKSVYTFSQLQKLTSSMYTGMMAKCVQALMGLGRIPLEWFDDPAVMKENQGVMKYSEYAKRTAASGVQIHYDYKFYRTHGIYRDGPTLWLVEVSVSRGVLAMPLPVFPKTRGLDPSKINDPALALVVREFNGIPTGEPIPQNVDKAIEDGTVIRLATPAQLDNVYAYSPYSSVCGWSFNESGRAALNCGFRYTDGDPDQEGAVLNLNIRIKTNPKWKPGKKGVPCGTGSAQASVTFQGRMRSGKFGLPVKHHEPMMQGIISHIALPQRTTKAPDQFRLFNAPVFAAYIDNQAVIGRFAGGGKPDNKTIGYDQTIGEKCFVGGSWTWEYTSGSVSLPNMVYTTIHDFRAPVAERRVWGSRTVTGGAPGPWRQGHDPTRPEWGSVTRARYYADKVISFSAGGEARGAILIAPSGIRNGYYMFQGRWYVTGVNRSESQSVRNIIVGGGTTWRDLFGRYTPESAARACKGKPPSKDPCADLCKCGLTGGHDRVICAFPPSTNPCVRRAGEIFPPGCGKDLGVNAGSTPTYSQYKRSSRDKSGFEGTWVFITDDHAFDGPIEEGNFMYWQTPSPSEFGHVQGLGAVTSRLGEKAVAYAEEGFNGVRKGFIAPVRESDPIRAVIGVNI